MAYSILLFDLDGTLTDPKEGITKSVAYALQALGIEASPNQLTAFIGPPLKDSFKMYYHMTDEVADKAIQKYRERFNKVGIFENRAFEGIHTLLDGLKKQGKKLAIATSKPYVFAIRILERYELAEYFDWIVGSELDGTRSKKSEVIEEVLRQAEVSEAQRNNCLMVGDRKHDIEGAKACGVDALGVAYGYAEKGELEAAGATYIVKDIQALSTFLMRH